MMLLYLLNMSGARSSIVSSIITPLLPYKCSGHGCACDIAGKELPGCACFGIEEDTDETAAPNHCGPPQDSCCSSKTEDDKKPSKPNESELDKVGCDGISSGLYEMLDRHLKFDTHIQTFYREIKYHISPSKLLANSKPNLISLGKIPIV